MPKPKVRVRGLSRLLRTLKAAGADLDDLSRLNAEVGELVAEAASPPVRSGRLAGSVRSSGTPRAAYVRAGGASVPYAGVQEFGWAARHIPAQPYFEPALDQTTAEIESKYLDQLDEILGTIQGA